MKPILCLVTFFAISTPNFVFAGNHASRGARDNDGSLSPELREWNICYQTRIKRIEAENALGKAKNDILYYKGYETIPWAVKDFSSGYSQAVKDYYKAEDAVEGASKREDEACREPDLKN